MKQIALFIWVGLIGCALGKTVGYNTFSYENSRYYVNPNEFRGNWMSAVEYCNRKDMDLVSLESEGELEAVWNWVHSVSNPAENNFQWWTSGNKLANDKDFIWHSTGQLVNAFGKWQTDQPNDYQSKQKCMQFWCKTPESNTGYYDDTNCGSELLAICEKRVDETYAVMVREQWHADTPKHQ